jgi:hypothetical protein
MATYGNGNGNGNGAVMTSAEPQLGEMGLTRVIPGEGSVETLVVDIGDWTSFTRPITTEGHPAHTTATDLIVDAIQNALGVEKGTRCKVLVSLQISVEVIKHIVEPSLEPGRNDLKTREFIGVSNGQDPALDEVLPVTNYDDEF